MDTGVKSVSILVETGDGRKKGRYGLDQHWSGVRDVQWKLPCFRAKHSYHFSDLRCQASHWLVAQLWRSLTIWNADRAFYAWTLCRQRIRVSLTWCEIETSEERIVTKRAPVSVRNLNSMYVLEDRDGSWNIVAEYASLMPEGFGTVSLR